MDMREDIGELNATLSIPAYEAAYSVGVEFLKQWFLCKFNPKFFKAFHVTGKHVLDDYKNFSINNILIKETPKAAMAVTVDYDYDRDMTDTYQFGIEHYVKRSRLKNAFFIDSTRNLSIGLFLEEMLMHCTYRVKVSEKAQQLRLFKYMQAAFRVKATQKNYIDVDFHIPYTLMLQLAYDVGFEIEKDNIKDKMGFLSYLNSHSKLPFLMKFRRITGRVEYFIRMTEHYTHITVPDNINPDDGDRNGQLDTGFMLEMTADFRMPVPQFYAYYSTTDHSNIDPTNTMHENNVSLDLCTITIPNIPEHNTKGWELSIRTDCEEDDLDGPLELNLKELFDGSDILKIIEYNNKLMISSDIFLDIKVYNNGRPIEFVINWSELKLTSTHKMISHISHMFIYVNTEYLNYKLTELNKYYSDRIRNDNNY